MPIKLAINGFGRIGRNILRALAERNYENVKVVAINSSAKIETSIHLFKYDTIHGTYQGDINLSGDQLDIGFGNIEIFPNFCFGNSP